MLAFLFSGALFAQQSDAKATQMLKDAAMATGGWDKLYSMNDVSYDYDYRYVGTGKADVSEERYIFEGEHSYGRYSQHDINVAPGMEGEAVQSLVKGEPVIVVGGKMKTEPEMIGGTDFLRRANYYWFTMPYKLNDPGVIATAKGTESIDGTDYEVVNVTFDKDITGKEVNDEYILYLNPETKLIDRFYFSLPAMGVNAPVILMENEYEDIDGMKIVTTRRIYQPGENGQLPDEPQLVQKLTNVKFDNGFTAEDLMVK